METRTCKICGATKSIDEFRKRRGRRYSGNARFYYCIPCQNKIRNEESKKWRLHNKEKVRQIKRNNYRLHREAIRAYQKKARDANPEKAREQNRAWVKANIEWFSEIRRESQKKWRKANAEKVREYAREYSAKHREKLLAMKRLSYHKHKEQISAKRKHRRANGEMRVGVRLYKQRARNAPGITTDKLLAQKLEYYGYRCRYCRKEISWQTLHFDHAIPLSRGGSNWTANMLPSCKTCNLRKRTKTFFEFIRAAPESR